MTDGAQLHNAAEIDGVLRSLYPHANNQKIADILRMIAEFEQTTDVDSGVPANWLLNRIKRNGTIEIESIKFHLDLWKNEIS